jgi:hypothetical protein
LKLSIKPEVWLTTKNVFTSFEMSGGGSEKPSLRIQLTGVQMERSKDLSIAKSYRVVAEFGHDWRRSVWTSAICDQEQQPKVCPTLPTQVSDLVGQRNSALDVGNR